MSITLTAEQEAIVQQTVLDGRFSTSAEALESALSILRSGQNPMLTSQPRTGPVRSRNLADLLSEYPWAGADIEIIRDSSPGREIDL